MKFNKKTMQPGFSTLVVRRQLQYFSNRDVTQADVERVQSLWLATGDTSLNRCKFVEVDWLGQPFNVLVSEYSTHYIDGHSCETFQIKSRGIVLAGVWLPEFIITALGGGARVTRLLAVAGLRGVLDEFLQTSDSKDPIIKELMAFCDAEERLVNGLQK